MCSFLARGTSGAWHQIGVLFDVVHIRCERLEYDFPLQAESVGGSGHDRGVKGGHLGLEGSNLIILSNVLRCLSYAI